MGEALMILCFGTLQTPDADSLIIKDKKTLKNAFI
jgi:hypothetical protein